MSRVTVVPARAAEGPTAPASSYDVGQKVKAAAWAGWALVVYAAGQSVACVCVGVARIIEARGRARRWEIGAAVRADMEALGWEEVE